MTQPIVTKIKNGKITLPKELQKDWKNGQVVFMPSPGGFLVKSITPPSLITLSKNLSKAAKKAGITSKDITRAVAWAKGKTYESRS